MACPSAGRWSFPSNHATAAALAAARLLSPRHRPIVVPLALAAAADRLLTGVHAPHDIDVGLLLAEFPN